MMLHKERFLYYNDFLHNYRNDTTKKDTKGFRKIILHNILNKILKEYDRKSLAYYNKRYVHTI